MDDQRRAPPQAARSRIADARPSAASNRDPLVNPEDWRILRALAAYRVFLVALLVGLHVTKLNPHVFAGNETALFYPLSVGYLLPSLLLLAAARLRLPSPRTQAHLSFAVDTVMIVLLMRAADGVSSGLGVLLITPAVGCSLILPFRLGLLHAALATFAVFGSEFQRQFERSEQYGGTINISEITTAGLIGLMLFVTVIGAGAVAGRARRSEALAERVGSDLENLSRLNERIIESMETAVLVVDEERRMRLLNAAGRRALGGYGGEGLLLVEVLPALASELEAWQSQPNQPPRPLTLAADGVELLPRFTRLGFGVWGPVLILLDDAARVREQAQQLKLAALGRLSASIAHEIRNPLSAIRQAGQLLSESPEMPADDLRMLDMIQRHTGRIDKIVEDVLRLSRREPAFPQTLRLQKFLEQCMDTYGEGNPAGARAVTIALLPDNLLIRFDPNHLQQVLHNLWQNSFEHAVKPDQTLRVEVNAGRLSPSQRIYLDVTDNGSGIPEPIREQIFEPFFTTAKRGTGLGLYLCRELCEYNQARLVYLPTPIGTQFRLIFAGA